MTTSHLHLPSHALLGALLLASASVFAKDAAPLADLTFQSASADLVAGQKATRLTGTDGLFDRIFIPEKETVHLRIALPAVAAEKEITITAPNGGKIVPVGTSKTRFTPKTTAPATLELDFTPTLGRGAYTITVQQGGATVTVDLWAGPTPPVGQPGPAYVPIRETEPETVP